MVKTPKRKEAGSFVLRVNGIALILLLSAILSGLVTDRETLNFEYHVVLGLASSVVGLFGLTLLMFYIVTTGGYIKEGVKRFNLEKGLTDRLSKIKARLFPLTMIAILLLIGLPVAGAALHAGNENRFLHLSTAIATAIMYVAALRSAKKELLENRAIALEVQEKSETL